MLPTSSPKGSLHRSDPDSGVLSNSRRVQTKYFMSCFLPSAPSAIGPTWLLVTPESLTVLSPWSTISNGSGPQSDKTGKSKFKSLWVLSDCLLDLIFVDLMIHGLRRNCSYSPYLFYTDRSVWEDLRFHPPFFLLDLCSVWQLVMVGSTHLLWWIIRSRVKHDTI